MTKNEYTVYIRQQLDTRYHTRNWEHAEFKNLSVGLWMNPNPNSFRLSRIGFVFFQDYSDLPCHEFSCQINLQPGHMLALDKKLSSPFYYTNAKSQLKLYVFDNTREILWLQLYNDLDKFLKNYQPFNG